MFSYVPTGVCSKRIEFEIKDGNISQVLFEGGCDGNLEGLSRLKGISCGKEETSCPDQLTLALKEWERKNV